MEGFGLRQALPEHHLHPATRHTASEAGGHAAHAGEGRLRCLAGPFPYN